MCFRILNREVIPRARTRCEINTGPSDCDITSDRVASASLCSPPQGQTFPLSVTLRAPWTIADITTKPQREQTAKKPIHAPNTSTAGDREEKLWEWQKNRDVTHPCEADDSVSVCVWGLALDVWKCEKWLVWECESCTRKHAFLIFSVCRTHFNAMDVQCNMDSFQDSH